MYRWLKDGAPVTDFSTGQYYRIPNTRRDDAGSYQCMARNDAGTIFSEKIDVVVACKYIICPKTKIVHNKWNASTTCMRCSKYIGKNLHKNRLHVK